MSKNETMPTVTIPANTHVRIGQPAHYPKGLLEALTSFIAISKDVENIFVGMHQVGEATPCLFGLIKLHDSVSQAQRENVIADIFNVAQEFLVTDEMDLGFYDESYAELCASDSVKSLKK